MSRTFIRLIGQAIRAESVEKALKLVSSSYAQKSGFAIRSTIEDLLPRHGKLTPKKSVKNAQWTFSTDSLVITRLKHHSPSFD